MDQQTPDQTPAHTPADVTDLRATKRTSLLIRTAKLVAQNGEYVCMVRDVSADGLRLRLFHPLPPETYMFLQLANGELYPMELVWQRDNEAGFRFARQINLDEFIEEPSAFARRPMRLNIQHSGLVFVAGRASPAMLIDLSQGGARIETTAWLALRQTVRLSLDGLPERFARVAWRDRYHHGLVFDQSLKLDELAAHAYQLQPYKPLEELTAPQVTPIIDTDDSQRASA
jgi:PilZ domain